MSLVPMTNEARRAGRQALFSAFDDAYAAGSAPSLASMRSEDDPGAFNLAKILDTAPNTERLLGMGDGILASTESFFPDKKASLEVTKNMINAYIKAAFETLDVPLPDLGQTR